MAAEECTNERVPRDGAASLQVCDAMVSRPKTLPIEASVADLRSLFENSHVETALLVDGDSFAGAIDRDELPTDVPGELPARGLARADVDTIAPDAPLVDAMARLDTGGNHRLVVVDRDGETLRGLLCLTRDRSGFCQSDPPAG